MDRTLSRDELSEETGVPFDILDWMARIGVLKSDQPGRFLPGDAFRAKMIAALLGAGFTEEQIGWGASEGTLELAHVDAYVLLDFAPRSTRTFGEFSAAKAPREPDRLAAVYQVLGLPEPDPSSPIRVDEEEILEQLLDGWSLARDDDTLIRAARLIGDGTRLAALGWPKLLEEKVAGPARDRFLRGDVDRFPPEVMRASTLLVKLIPRIMAWLTQRYLEQLIFAGIVDGFEAVLAARGLAPAPEPAAPPAVVFADLSGYTRLTDERGDEAAVRIAASLQSRAETVATERGGRLVKLLGDGAMLHFPEPANGLEAAIDLVNGLTGDLGVAAHAGVHVGPVVERDRDLFGRTVNLASRISAVAGAGEVLVSDAVVRAADDGRFRFDPAGTRELKGFAEPVPVFRVVVRSEVEA